MWKYIKTNLHIILFAILALIVLGIVTNAIADGIGRIVTQQMINDTYLIHR
ncbi:hypothetical protein pEaSNUABM50_00419 [Erwinia phage pEa_SNUABM_50]|uniref:Uncharacterized protein n=4 Tax=Eneladusvirus BF TaxID=2560751 RepID=A0A7L8ZNN3_9CAUD|nr:hypothetical protein FDH34_gp504 [Serratia phage BF]QOI71355.1 hypothetical protein pEaSNUABM12_00425 [Erwinia phage pEa_SNUABM_12]QOI71897.1 hypothetical protein pEaSNUABM47_00421 [Erwinia phage pEa_SNUABM_47]QOI72436.1 hypothetical protein pEaSNUABM50_00419 [Erwinia phage pEa_SNUABM_50]QXO11563.1 hypothetical protein pEaSNUABM19_00425 [Erwinia phage pEa_SNUABM_19]QXO12111.1 hypothetical protein pEaSNUABM44_00423 [Erwinia phage pEa_SNUABM_44]QXO12664.1 hypothetical protein pEaSNUABM49_004